jgi:flagellar basal body rod protein FlgC
MNGAVIHGFSAPIQVQILQRKENARRHSEIEEEQVEEEPPQKRMKQEPTEEQIEIQEPVEEPNTNVVREMLQYKLRMAQNAGNQEEVSKIELKLASL